MDSTNIARTTTAACGIQAAPSRIRPGRRRVSGPSVRIGYNGR